MATNFDIAYWNGEKATESAETMKALFERVWGGPVRKTGYNRNGVWFTVNDDGIGYVMNSTGDDVATITESGK